MNSTEDDAPSAGAAQPPLSDVEAASADRRRVGLQRLLDHHRLNPTDLARDLGLTTPNAIYNFLAGRSASLSLDTIERILDLYPDISFAALIGKPDPDGERARAMQGLGDYLAVTLEARAGYWKRIVEPRGKRVGLDLPGDFDGPGAGGFALRVREPGAELLYPAGSILVCRELPGDTSAVPDGSRVVLRVIQDGRTEITLRELVRDATHAWLCPRTTRPEHLFPIRVRGPLHGTFPVGKRGLGAVIGVVTASWRPEATSTSE